MAQRRAIIDPFTRQAIAQSGGHAAMFLIAESAAKSGSLVSR
jgi:hypothetical protein